MDAAVSIELFVEILNQYVYYFDQENEAVTSPEPNDSCETCLPYQVTTKYINGLIELIHSNASTSDPTPALENPKKHFQRTLDYISSRGYEGVVTAAATEAKA
jgi:vacuolar protein sorting-associated protein 35